MERKDFGGCNIFTRKTCMRMKNVPASGKMFGSMSSACHRSSCEILPVYVFNTYDQNDA